MRRTLLPIALRLLLLVSVLLLLWFVSTSNGHEMLVDQAATGMEDAGAEGTEDHGALLDQMLGKIEQERFDYRSAVVKNEFIVSYHSYLSTLERWKILSGVLSEFDPLSWKIVPRSNPASNQDSDFSLIQLLTNTTSRISALESHASVKSIVPQRKVTRVLKNSDGWVARKLSRATETEQEMKSDEQSSPHNSRKVLRNIPRQVSHILQANLLWGLGHRGKGVKVAIFDTGLNENHNHFKNVKDRTDWTDDKTLNDEVGHGTFVAGVIASERECYGLAPEADLYIFRVFTNKQISYTSWFLDAFNYAISKNVHILNLSIGGPDFMDRPFVDKVWELTSNGVVMVSAIGNDGPLYGTLNNPADQMDVIGIGGINFDDQIARFSSRGMTTWELPAGYGRMKPDLVTYGANVRGSNWKGGCRSLSGTSVASPVVSGAIALLISSVAHKHTLINPASVKQALISSASRLPDANMFEQGNGKLDLIKAYRVLSKYKPHASASPSYIDLTEAPYMWPYHTQPLFHTGVPVVVNLTILNGMAASGHVSGKPIWRPFTLAHTHMLDVSFSYSEKLWPWSGYLAIHMRASQRAAKWSGEVRGVIVVNISSFVNGTDTIQISSIKIPVKAKIIPTPPRSQRILWDQFHNLRYPSGYFPRDNLEMKQDPLDWNADHPHTNFRDLYTHLRKRGYYVDILGSPFTCFDAHNYGTLLIVDPEEEYFASEITKLKQDVHLEKLSVIVIAEWYNIEVMRKIKFFDENTRQWWTPDTGGANLPALNELLASWGIQFSNHVYNGDTGIGDNTLAYSSGTSLSRFPLSGTVIRLPKLTDQARQITAGVSETTAGVPVLGLYSPDGKHTGRIVVYGDSNCLDSAHMQTDCFWLIDELLNYTSSGVVPRPLTDLVGIAVTHSNDDVPVRLPGNRMNQFSKVVAPDSSTDENIRHVPLPACPSIVWPHPIPINKSAPANLFRTDDTEKPA